MSEKSTQKQESESRRSLHEKAVSAVSLPEPMDTASFTMSEILKAPMPLTHRAPTKWLTKLTLLLFGNKVVEVRGLR
ncbi:MAG: 1-acyl-sn-glycerol-3-phosphate acyltransferase, partial [Verrucomicrobiota bacterium]|nr:1-acyl-sn-glycerol-3-phosphate acyltransferase [Verrucomicrobiota bacterium]